MQFMTTGWRHAVAACLFLFSVHCLGSGAAYATSDVASGPTPPSPNFIVILTDDLGYGDIGAFGADKIKTPNLDAMAEQGAVLTNFYAAANICTPSRAGLLTGRYPIRTGLGHQVIMPDDTRGLPAEEITIAEMLGDKGYRTALVGKWHLGHQENHWPTLHGFEDFFGLIYSNDMTPLVLYRGTDAIEQPVDQTTLTQRYTQEAIRFIEDGGEKPFFLYLAHTFPHIPLFASERFDGRSEAGRYGDTVEELDWSTGEILKALKRLGKDSNTLVVFTSDNGPWFEGSAGPLRNRKGSTWEGGYRVPFIAQWPGQIEGGRRSDAIAMGIDILPTLAALANIDMQDARTIDGKNIWPVLTGADESPHEHLLLFNNEDIVGVRTQDWKLATHSYYREHYIPLSVFDYWLLFDMSDGVGESYSLARENPAIFEKLRSIAADETKKFEPLRKVPAPSIGPATEAE